MVKNKKWNLLLNIVLSIVFMFMASTKAHAQVDLFKGIDALRGVVEHVQRAASRSNDSTGGIVGGLVSGNAPRNAAEYCDAIKSNPMVIEYLPVLAKAVKTKVTAFDKEVREDIDLRFDTADAQLKGWVDAAPSPTGEPRKVNTSNFGRYVKSWASLCAAQNNDNDLFLFFISDLRNPVVIAELRAKAKDALKTYGASSAATKLDANGLPVQVTNRSNEALKFDLGYEGAGTFNLNDPLWVTLAAFALPNGATAMQSTGKGKATVLMAQIDEAVAANDKLVIQNAAEKKLAEKAEATRLAAEAKTEAAKETQKNSPNALLQQAYQAMQLVQLCSDVRKGYAAIYVSDAELANAKDKMRRIETTLKPKLTGETSDQIWNKASSANADYFRGVRTATYANGRGYCDLFKRDMDQIADKTLGSALPAKSF